MSHEWDRTLGEAAITAAAITTSGGWCAPTKDLYDSDLLGRELMYDVISLELPNISILRPGTPEHDARQREVENQRIDEEMAQRYVHRVIGDAARAQDRHITAAYIAADAAGMDLKIVEPSHGHTMWRWNRHGDLAAYRFIGLELVERSTEHWRRLQGDRAIILRETASDRYDYDWDED